MNYDDMFRLLENNNEIWKRYKIFTKIHINKINTLGLIDTIYKHTHISFFKDQWNTKKLFHITIGETDDTKCAYYLTYTNGNIIEPENFLYEQPDFNESASRRKKCNDKIIKILKITLQCIFEDLNELLKNNISANIPNNKNFYNKYKKYKSLYLQKKKELQKL